VQTFALLLDSWRLLLSRRLFWLTLALNVIVVLLYGSIAITDSGFSLFYGLWEIENEQYRASTGLARTVLLPIVSYWMISYWLAWFATGLGLISTASIIPDFLAEGAIDMVLAKPISRTKAFFVKYLGGLLFVLLQVTVFCTGSFLVNLIRLGEWQWMLFAAIPVVTLFFSYMFAVSVFFGVVTRSSIAAILAAAVFWFVLFIAQGAESISHMISAAISIQTEAVEKRDAADQEKFAAMKADGLTSDDNSFERLRGEIEARAPQLTDLRRQRDLAAAWHNGFYIAVTVLPKTKATIALIDRWFAPPTGGPTSLQELFVANASRNRPPRPDRPGRAPGGSAGEMEMEPGQVEARVLRDESERSLTWVIGTSIAFELVVLGGALWIFRRRDF